MFIDIVVRLFYCSGISLTFDSQQFNNMASPLISFFGFIGLIITVSITLNQFKLQQSASYFDYYRTLTNKILEEKKFQHSTIELLDFVMYADSKYAELKKDATYLIDLNLYKAGHNVTSTGKSYDRILGEVRLFRTQLSLLLKRYEQLLTEIKEHKNLSISHKDLLLKELFSNQILPYIFGLRYLDSSIDLTEVKDNLFIAFASYAKELWPFFDSNFYDLRKLVEKDSLFSKYLNYQL